MVFGVGEAEEDLLEEGFEKIHWCEVLLCCVNVRCKEGLFFDGRRYLKCLS